MTASQVPAKPLLLGGRFELGGTLTNRGRFRVCEGYDTREGRKVVLKMTHVSGEDAFDTNLLRLQREAVVLWCVRDEHIVRLIDAGAFEGGYFLALEHLEGPTLDDTLRHVKILDVRTAASVMLCVLAGLSVLHRAGIIHRDIKPGNIMLGMGGVRIIDFDLATCCARIGRRAKRITEHGIVIGTPSHMAPEQCQGYEDQDARVDLYACGVVLYEMLVGKGPYPSGGKPRQMLLRHVHAKPESFDHAAPNGNIPQALQDVVYRALAKRREDRFQTADDMRAAILAALS